MADLVKGEERICPTCGQPGSANFCLHDGTPLRVGEEENLVGQVLHENYRIVELIGSGGMGSVYKAVHLHLDTPVAVKVINSQLGSDSEAYQRFQREGKIINSLIHPGIVRALDFGVHEGKPFLVMDYVDGESLYVRLAKVKRLEARRAVSIFLQICDALSYAHLSGVLHRDLKPANIMLMTTKDKQDAVRLLDFGLAKLVNQGGNVNWQRLTQTGSFIGTPEYMSPEQCLGKVNEMDARTDIYSLGCIMYETLSGKPPITGTNVLEILHNQIKETPQTFQQLGIPGVAPQLESVIFKAMNKSADDRPSSMMELHREIERASRPSFSDIQLSPPKPVEQPGLPPLLKNGWLAAGLLAVALCGLLGVLAMQQMKIDKSAPPPAVPRSVLSGTAGPAPAKSVSTAPTAAVSMATAPTPVVHPGAHSVDQPSQASVPPTSANASSQRSQPAGADGAAAKQSGIDAHAANATGSVPPAAPVAGTSHESAVHGAASHVALVAPPVKPYTPPKKSTSPAPDRDKIARLKQLESAAQAAYDGKDRDTGDAFIRQAIDLRKTIDPSADMVNDAFELCKTAYMRRKWDQLELRCQEAQQLLKVAHARNKDQLRANINGYLGLAYLGQGKLDEASTAFTNALKGHGHGGSNQTAWMVLDLKGLRTVLLHQQKYDEVIDYGVQALQYVSPHSRDEAEVQYDMGVASLRLKDYATADTRLATAQHLFRENSAWEEFARTLDARALSLRQQRRYLAASKLYTEASSWYGRLHHHDAERRAENDSQACENAASPKAAGKKRKK